MKKTIFSKVFSGYFLIILIVSVLIFILSFKAIQNFYIETLTSRLVNIGFALENSISPFIAQERFSELQDFISEMGPKIDLRITVIDSEGVVLADSEKDPKDMENHRNRPEIIKAYQGETGGSLRYSTTVKEKMLYMAMPVDTKYGPSYILRLSFFLKGIYLLLGILKIKIVQGFFIAVFIGVIVAVVFSKTISNPVKELSLASNRLAGGDFEAKVFLKRKDELKNLADSFNDMSEKVKILFSEMSRQKEELKNIITSIQEGLAVIDRGGRIKVCNDSFKDITGNQSPEGDFYWKVLRGPESLNIAIKDAQIKKAGFQQEVFLSNRVLICNGSFLSELDDVVITFYDITDIKKLENIKKDFVANVSHELKTPLTAVKGYLETIYDEVADETRGYLDIVLRHTDRLINIVNDLLLLSKLEDAEKIKAENINITEILDNVLSIFKSRIKEKGLMLNVKISESLGTVKADYFKLEQLLINLIDNAVKYTEKGCITVEAYPHDGSIAIKIRDTGIGIPKECLDRIFERFFVVDKSHSKESSGTGLGLSIAKHIVSLHKGSIRVESSLSEGSVFTVFLPVIKA